MPTRRLLVLGASGRTGSHVVTIALARGLDVTVLVRDPGRLAAMGKSLRVVKGDILSDSPAIRGAFANQDAVISVLGVPGFKSGGLIAHAAPVIVEGMHEHRVRRLVFTSAFGVGSTSSELPLVPRLFTKTLLREVYADKAAGEKVVRDSDLDWTVVYPAGLTDKPASGAPRVGEHVTLSGFPTVSRADVAAVLVKQLDDPAFVRKGIFVAS